MRRKGVLNEVEGVQYVDDLTCFIFYDESSTDDKDRALPEMCTVAGTEAQRAGAALVCIFRQHRQKARATTTHDKLTTWEQGLIPHPPSTNPT